MGGNRIPLAERARGQWRGILPQLGVAAEFLTGKHTACPICRAGVDRFMFDDRENRGTWICHQCDPSAGDGIALVMAVNGWSFKEAAERVEALIGTVEAQPLRAERSPESKRQALNRLWSAAAPIRPDDPVARYLAARVGLTAFPPVLRCHPRARYEDETPSWYPAMIAMITDACGAPASLHRTYLTKDGLKADVPAPRRVMPGHLPPGSAVRLFPPAPTLGIAEGIETAFAAASLFGVPCWSALNSTLLEQWQPPPEAEEVVVFGDNDPKFGGQAAAYRLAHRLSKRLRVRIEIPAAIGEDWNDALLATAERRDASGVQPQTRAREAA